MAEFCLDCLEKLDGREYRKRDFYLSKELELCEGCGEWKHVVLAERGYAGLGLLGVLGELGRAFGEWMREVL